MLMLTTASARPHLHLHRLLGALQTSGSCTCDPGWKGVYCAVLDLVPAPSLAGAYQHTVVDPAHPTNTSSWGGLPVKGDGDGLYHLFAAQFVQNCTLGGWNPGSEVIRATASSPFGPFTYGEKKKRGNRKTLPASNLLEETDGLRQPLRSLFVC